MEFFTYVLPIAIALTGLFLAFRTSMLRDVVSTKTESIKVPYSFSRVQLLWWSIIIIWCCCYHFGNSDSSFPPEAYNILIVIGISLGTTTAAKIIDNVEIRNKQKRHQDEGSQGFFYDILSDENGISVHRFQACAFNLIFGLKFLIGFLVKEEILSLGEIELGLMGISSTAYLGLKMNENTHGKGAAVIEATGIENASIMPVAPDGLKSAA